MDVVKFLRDWCVNGCRSVGVPSHLGCLTAGAGAPKVLAYPFPYETGNHLPQDADFSAREVFQLSEMSW